VRQVGQAWLRPHAGVPAAQQPEQPPHLGQRLPAGGADRAQGGHGDLRIPGRRIARAVGLHHDHGQAVGDHVVHLPGDAGALVLRGQLHLTLGRPLRLLGAFDQRGDVPLPLLSCEAQCPGGREDGGDGDDVGDHRGRGEGFVAEVEEPAHGRDAGAGVADRQGDHALPPGRPAGDGVDRDREGELAHGRGADQHGLESARRGDDGEGRHGVVASPHEGKCLDAGQDRCRGLAREEVAEPAHDQQPTGEGEIEPPATARAELPRAGVVRVHAGDVRRMADGEASAHGRTRVHPE